MELEIILVNYFLFFKFQYNQVKGDLMKDILLLNVSVFIRLILAFISLLIGLQGNYLLAFGVLFIIAILDYYDLF